MPVSGKSRLWLALYAAGAVALGASGVAPAMEVAAAGEVQDSSPATQGGEATQLEGVTVIGSRRYARAAEVEAPVPVDVIPMVKAAEQGAQFDLAQTLQYISPSFNSTRQTGADGADLIDSASLRGLGSDQTLVLVNGKRRHTMALVNLFGARNRGNTGTDMNAIPLLAIEHVQVLRDGAAAQYGSDAIAGVINIELKKSLGCEGVLGYGQYSRGDGENYLASAYCGFAVGDEGVLGDHRRILRPRPLEPRRSRQPAHHRRHQVENQYRLLQRRHSRSARASCTSRPASQNRDASSGRVRARRHRFGRHPFAQLGGDVPGRLRPVHQRATRRSLRHPRLPPASATGAPTSRRPTATTSMTLQITHTMNASIANLDLAQRRRWRQPDALRRRRLLVPPADHATSTSARFYDGILHGMNVGLRRRVPRENYQIFAGRTGFVHRRRRRRHRRQRGQPGLPGLPAGRRDRPQPPQHRRLCRHRGRHDRSAELQLRAAPRALLATSARPPPASWPPPSKRHRRRAAARLGQHRFPCAAPAAALLLLDLHRLHQRRAGRRRAGAERRRDRQRGRHPAAERRKIEELHARRDLDPRPSRPRSRPTCTASISTTASCCRAASTPTTTRRSARSCSRSASARRSSSSTRSTRAPRAWT